MTSLRATPLLLFLSCVTSVHSLTDLTLQPGPHGQQVVEAAVAAIFDKCFFNDDFRFLRRLAYVISHDGDDLNYQPGNSTGGIWQVRNMEVRFWPKVGQIGSKWDKESQNVLKSDR